MQKTKKVVCLLGAVMLAAGMMAFPVCAKEANVAGVIEETWSSAEGSWQFSFSGSWGQHILITANTGSLTGRRPLSYLCVLC